MFKLNSIQKSPQTVAKISAFRVLTESLSNVFHIESLTLDAIEECETTFNVTEVILIILDISSQDRDLFTPVLKLVVYKDTPIIGLLFENNFLS